MRRLRVRLALFVTWPARQVCLVRLTLRNRGGLVGASGWEYRVPFTQSVGASLVALQEDVLLG
jgi:hypothetical protein